MGYQKLKGVVVTPLGNGNRFYTDATLKAGFGVASKAFGGWIYNASVEIGFSQQPTSITLDITLDVQDGEYKTNTSDFRIKKEDLKVSAPGGTAGESYYEIKFGTKVYKPMFLSSYEISGSADSKTLKVKFLDYSIILDKIYIAVFKKQAYDRTKSRFFKATPVLNVLCPGCAYDDGKLYEVQATPTFNLETAAYFYNYKNPYGSSTTAPKSTMSAVQTHNSPVNTSYNIPILNFDKKGVLVIPTVPTIEYKTDKDGKQLAPPKYFLPTAPGKEEVSDTEYLAYLKLSDKDQKAEIASRNAAIAIRIADADKERAFFGRGRDLINSYRWGQGYPNVLVHLIEEQNRDAISSLGEQIQEEGLPNETRQKLGNAVSKELRAAAGDELNNYLNTWLLSAPQACVDLNTQREGKRGADITMWSATFGSLTKQGPKLKKYEEFKATKENAPAYPGPNPRYSGSGPTTWEQDIAKGAHCVLGKEDVDGDENENEDKDNKPDENDSPDVLKVIPGSAKNFPVLRALGNIKVDSSLGEIKKEPEVPRLRTTTVKGVELRAATATDTFNLGGKDITTKSTPATSIEPSPFFPNSATAPSTNPQSPKASYGGTDLASKLGAISSEDTFKSYYEKTYKNSITFPANNSGSKTPTNGSNLDINGGSVVLGTEEFNQSLCGSASAVNYNFTELISTLAVCGLNFSQINSASLMTTASDMRTVDKNINYRKNYNGTLREVLVNWCADFALDFYVDGTTIHFVDLSRSGSTTRENDMTIVEDATKSGSVFGALFNSDTQQALGSFTESADIAEAYSQNIVTFYSKPRKSENRSKEKKNGCGFLAMHPLDLLNPNLKSLSYPNMYGRLISRPVLINAIWGGTGRHWYTNRTFDTIDKCAAIGKYSSVYRNIYAGGLACDCPKLAKPGVAQTDALKLRGCMEGFNSFAFMPLYKIETDDEQIKLDIIEKVFKQDSNGHSRYILDHRAFDLWVGFRNEDEFEELIQWEKTIAENMYKYGTLAQGPSKYTVSAPFVPEDFASQVDAQAGIKSGSMRLLKISSSSTPQFERGRFFEDVPFKDLFKSSREYLTTIVRNLPIASLDNDWGTAQEVFDDQLRVTNHNSANCANYGQSKLIKDGDADGADQSPDSFSVKDFEPQFYDLPDDFFEDGDFSDLKTTLLTNTSVTSMLGKLLKTEKHRIVQGQSVPYTQAQCPRLQIMIIPRVLSTLPIVGSGNLTTDKILHPHLKVQFGFGQGQNQVQQLSGFKRRYLEYIESQKELKQTICENSLEEIACNMGQPVHKQECADYSASQSGCVCITPVQPVKYAVGFPDSGGNVARKITIEISVHHNTSRYINSSSSIMPLAGGGVGFQAEDEDYPVFIPVSKTSSIVYPRQSDVIDTAGVNTQETQTMLYRGVITQSATTQNRNSEAVECYGSLWCGDANVSKIQMINNEIAQEVEQILDPTTSSFFTPIFDMQGNVVRNVAAYHNLMVTLSELNKTGNDLAGRVMKFEIVGNALDIPGLAPYLAPAKGLLRSLSFTLSPDGFRTHLSFSNRPDKLPKPEAVMNKVRATF